MRIVSAEEAVAGIHSGDHLYLHGASATPSVLLDALVARAPDLEDVKVVHLHAEGPGPHLAPEMAGHFRHIALFIGPNARDAVNDGRAEYVPVFLSDIPKLFRRGTIPIDTVLLNVSPPDAHGFCSLGTSVDAVLAAIRTARTVVAQINRRMPRTLGDAFVHVNTIDLGVEVDVPPYERPPDAIGPVAERIGAHVAELVPDEATLQMGIGAIPSAVALALRDKRDLGVHTELFTDVVVDLVEVGAITGRAKEINQGKIVSAFLMGTKRLYEFVHDNPMVEMRPVDYTNDTAIIRRFKRMTAINSAIEIDLTGQVCADSIGGRLYSGVGGQMDFVRGASLAEEGRAIIALPSTAAGGTLSRIVAALQPGAGVTTTRSHVQTVVTEWGVAELQGRSLQERARSLIAIAHPDFREPLAAAAHALTWSRTPGLPLHAQRAKPSMRVLVLNAGSSSLKASLVEGEETRERVTVEWGADASVHEDQEAGLREVLDRLLVGLTGRIDAVGHRVVHGGDRFTEPVVIDDTTAGALAALVELAPLHNPVALETVAAARRMLPAIPHVAVFDTAFHATLPESWRRYPLPAEWHDRWGIRRFGFHGLSVTWSTRRAAQLLGRSSNELSLVVAHLGSGCSVTAVERGRSTYTSMGMTPLEGLMMGTRSGSVDPGVLIEVLRDGRIGLAELADTLDHRSGLLGVSGRGADMRELLAAASDGDDRAALAIKMFVIRAAAGIGAAATSLERLDAIVFTGGIGEHAAPIRVAIVTQLAVFGVPPLPATTPDGQDGVLGPASPGPAVVRVEAREDLVIAEEVGRLVG